MSIIHILNILSIILIIIGIFLLLLSIMVIIFDKKEKHSINKKAKIAVMIPARDESTVIEGLLKSIEKQSYKVPMKNIYIIVENKDDPTIKISKKYHCNIIIRKSNIPSTKGGALDDGIKYILKQKKKYDLYFIFDADNVLEKDFFKKMVPYYHLGYDMVTSHRLLKNKKKKVLPVCSFLTFSLVNGFCNEIKQKHNANITITGTGYFIKGTLINKWKGFPFHTLTEDYELTLYSILNNLKTFYQANAYFFDEQPIHYKDSKNQRTRWIRGYLDVRKKYIRLIKKNLNIKNNNLGSQLNELIGIWPYVFIILGTIILLLTNTIGSFWLLSNCINKGLNCFSVIPITVISIYIILSIITTSLIEYENKKLNINMWEKIKTLIFHPIFLISYIPCAIKALFHKNLQWEKINHITNQNGEIKR